MDLGGLVGRGAKPVGRSAGLTHEPKRGGRFRSWTDAGHEVEIRLPLPPGTTASELRVDVEASSLVVSRQAPAAQELLSVNPLYDGVMAGEHAVWYVETDKLELVLVLEKERVAPWPSTLHKEGGRLACWEGAASA